MIPFSLPGRRSPRRPPSMHTQGPRFKGVRMRSWGRWVSEIRIPRSRDKIWLGSHPRPELAARAYDTAFLLLRGPSASSSLNLSDSFQLIAPHLPKYTNGLHAITRRMIQTAVAAIANAVASVETPLLCSTTEEQETARALQPDAESAEASYTDGLSENKTEESWYLQDQLVCMESRWIHDAITSLSPREKMRSSLFPASAAASNYTLQGEGTLSCRDGLSETEESCYLQDQLVRMESRWIHDAVSSLSPREKMRSTLMFSASAAPSNYTLQGDGTLSSSNNLDQQQLMTASSLAVCEEFHQALQQGLAQDGFAPMSATVTTRERFDKDVAPASDALWSYP